MINFLKNLIEKIKEEYSFRLFIKDLKLERGNIMPEYDYECTKCGTVTRITKSMSDDSAPVCKNCGDSEVVRLFRPVQLKGCGSSSGGCGGCGGGSSCGGCGS